MPPNELFYKAIKSKNADYIKADNSVSSSAFKDSKGVSVDREYNRKELDIINSFNRRFDNRAIISSRYADILEKDIFTLYKPKIKNVYHYELYKDRDKSHLTNAQAKHLARRCIIVFQK